jgi:hypothetical protein
MATKAPDEIPEPWFKPKRIGYGLTPITWQGWFVTFLLMVVLSVSVYAVTDLIRDPLNVVIVLLILISIEVTVFILFSYDMQNRSMTQKKTKQTYWRKERRSKKIWRNGRGVTICSDYRVLDIIDVNDEKRIATHTHPHDSP